MANEVDETPKGADGRNVYSYDPVKVLAWLAANGLVKVHPRKCEHEWKEVVDSQFSNEHETDVRCTRCGMAGSRSELDGGVYWPAT